MLPVLCWMVRCGARTDRTRQPPVVFPSSVTVFGADPERTRLLGPNDPVVATDHYTRHKLACEEILRRSQLHPADVARAQTNALGCPEAWGRVLLIGGGPACRVRHHDLLDALFEALGVGRCPRAAFGVASYYTDWMDTAESERLLRYQRHTFATFRRDLARRLRPAAAARPALPAPLLRAVALAFDDRPPSVTSAAGG